ncbi:MAG: DsbA family protein [Paracoccaceae bacterium]|jgi:protein-disulfide isomerase
MTYNPSFTRRAALAIIVATAAYSGLPAFAQSAESIMLPEMSIGAEDAPITLIEYASFTCPHCKNFHADVLPLIKENYIDTGKVRLIYRGIYFDRLGLWADMLAQCGGPDRYFGITAMIYEKQSEWTSAENAVGVVDNLYTIGRLAGLNQDDMEACMQDNKTAQALVTFSTENAEIHDVQGTPTFVINGKTVTNMPYSGFVEEFERLLAE